MTRKIEKPQVHVTETGSHYVYSKDILTSKVGREAIRRIIESHPSPETVSKSKSVKPDKQTTSD